MSRPAARLAFAPPRVPDERPGRACPIAYRYPPSVFDRAPERVAQTLYVVGGLYGNVEALEALEALVGREPGAACVVFNGDFHWFDAAPGDFERIGRAVALHDAIRGNVETELTGEESGAGCGCAYPADVSDADVSRSNAILERLRETARAFPDLREREGALAMHRVARVGEARVGIVHGDAAALAGWGFGMEALDNPAHARWVGSAFREARVDVFASSHTCLPACRVFGRADGPGAVINNGAAGMPNFAGTTFGVVTRISTRRARGESLYGTRIRGAFVEALALEFDAPRWIERFLSTWPAGTPAHASYFRRLTEGPRHDRSRAAPAP